MFALTKCQTTDVNKFLGFWFTLNQPAGEAGSQIL